MKFLHVANGTQHGVPYTNILDIYFPIILHSARLFSIHSWLDFNAFHCRPANLECMVWYAGRDSMFTLTKFIRLEKYSLAYFNDIQKRKAHLIWLRLT